MAKFTGEFRELEAVYDMYYGSRKAWRDDDFPLLMDFEFMNPVYVQHCEREWRAMQSQMHNTNQVPGMNEESYYEIAA